jgi:hypothetical protein
MSRKALEINLSEINLKRLPMTKDGIMCTSIRIIITAD